jgi:hypothetical protein
MQLGHRHPKHFIESREAFSDQPNSVLPDCSHLSGNDPSNAGSTATTL